MSCPTCGRTAIAGECAEGYMPYLSGDYPCPFNPDPLAVPKNLRTLPPRPVYHPTVLRSLTMPTYEAGASSDGLEDLL